MKVYIPVLAMLLASASAMSTPNFNYRGRVARQGNYFNKDLISNELSDVPLARQGGEPDDTEEMCVQKVMNIDRTVFDEEERCTHISNKECHLTYVTKHKHVERQDCKEEFVKTCNIEVVDRPFNHEIEVCSESLQQNADCDCKATESCPEVCVTSVMSVCSSNLKEQIVEVDVPSCSTEFETVCKPDDPTNCFKVPKQVCTTMKMDVRKLTGEPSCKPEEMTRCNTVTCPITTAATPECHKEMRTEVKKELEETCNVTPNKVCSTVMEPMPVLEQIEQCVDVPKEICSMVRVNPRIISEPTIRQWCGPANLLPTGDDFSPVESETSFLRDIQNPVAALVAQEEEDLPEVTGRKVTFSPEAMKEMLERANVNVRVAGDSAGVRGENSGAIDDGRTAKIWNY